MATEMVYRDLIAEEQALAYDLLVNAPATDGLDFCSWKLQRLGDIIDDRIGGQVWAGRAPSKVPIKPTL